MPQSVVHIHGTSIVTLVSYCTFPTHGGDPSADSDEEAELDAIGAAEHGEGAFASDFDDDDDDNNDGDGGVSDAQEGKTEYGIGTIGHVTNSKGKDKERPTIHRRGGSSSGRQLRSQTGVTELTVVEEHNDLHFRASRSRAGAAERENEPSRQSQRLALRTRAGSWAEMIGRRPRRAAATKKIDYARLNEGEELDDSASNDVDDHHNDTVKSGRRTKIGEEDEDYVQSCSGEEGGNGEGGASDEFLALEDSDDSVSERRDYSGRKNIERKISLHRSSCRPPQQEEEETEEEDEPSRTKRSRRPRNQQRRKRRKVVADTDSDEDEWEGETVGLEAGKAQGEKDDGHGDGDEREEDNDHEHSDDDDDEGGEEEGLSHGQILYMQQMQEAEGEADATTFFKNMAPRSIQCSLYTWLRFYVVFNAL